MDDDKHLIPYILERARIAERDEHGNVQASIVIGRIDINRTSLATTDVTPGAAKAMVEQAHQMYAVPAQEATKQAQEVTKRSQEMTKQAQEMTKWETQFTVRHFGVVAAVVLMAVLVWLKPEAALGISALGTVLGGVYLGTTYITKKQEGAKKAEVDAGSAK